MREARALLLYCVIISLTVIIVNLYVLDSLPNARSRLAGEEEKPILSPPLPVDNPYEQEADDTSLYEGEEGKRHYDQQQRLRSFCRKKRRKQPDNETLGHLYVFEKYKVIFCLVPKVASRQWMNLLGRYRISMGFSPYGPTVKQFPPEKASKMLKTFYKFMFVREPFERLLSAYKDKFLHPRAFDRNPYITVFAKKIIANYRSNASRQTLHSVTFPEFVEYILNLGVREGLDWHWGRYEDICGVCDVKYDYVGHYEKLEEDSKFVLQRANLTHLISPRFHRSRTIAELKEFYSQIPQEWIVRLGEVYRSNFEMFGYSFPGALEELLKSEN